MLFNLIVMIISRVSFFYLRGGAYNSFYASKKSIQLCILLFIGLFFGISSVYSQNHMLYHWERLPSDREINKALEKLSDELNANISVNGEIVDNKSGSITPVIKSHNPKRAGKDEPHLISDVTVFAEQTGIMGSRILGYHLFFNGSRFGFAKIVIKGTSGNSLKDKYNKYHK